MAKALGRRRIALGTGLAVAVAVAVALTLTTGGASAGLRGNPSNTLRLTVGAPMRVHPIPSGFLGLSIEYPSIEPYAGTDPNAVNPVLLQLIRNLAPNQSPVLRIGGDSTDWEWWPVPHMKKPGGVRYALTRTWVAVTRALTQQLDARLILGLDLEANSQTLYSTEASHLIGGLGQQAVEAFEPGNEPELYGSWAWYRTASGHPVTGRPSSWNIDSFAQQLGQAARALSPTPLAGPAAGSTKWIAELGQFLRAAPFIKLVTVHRYPVQLCYTPRSAPTYPSIENLLAPRASRGLAASVAPSVRLAHGHGIPIRVDEMNTNSCGSATRVTGSFATALWALDTLFAMAATGVDGVNVHTYQGSSYELFAFGHTHSRWSAQVEPEYYGLLLFAQGAPPGSQLLHLYGPATSALRAWATRGADGRLRITLINDDLEHSRTIAIKAAGDQTAAQLTRLTAPHPGSHTGVAIGGQSFGARTTTGHPAGTERSNIIAPTGGDYVVKVPPASAALLVR
jgi:hypothetical protein